MKKQQSRLFLKGPWKWAARLITSLVLMIILVLSLTFYRNHDLPNPIWGIFNTTYSYQLPDGPPGHDLMDSQPEAIFTQYVQDYIQVAGTYPCSDSLQDYQLNGAGTYHWNDPVLNGKVCLAPKRIVTSIRIDHVFVTNRSALLTYHIVYNDGTYWNDEEYINPTYSQSYFLARIHLRCWSSTDLIDFYYWVTHLYHISTPNLQNSYQCINGNH